MGKANGATSLVVPTHPGSICSSWAAATNLESKGPHDVGYTLAQVILQRMLLFVSWRQFYHLLLQSKIGAIRILVHL